MLKFSYDNALTETINGLYKAGAIHRQTMAQLKYHRFATSEWSLDQLPRPFKPINNIPPAEAIERYSAMLDEADRAA